MGGVGRIGKYLVGLLWCAVFYAFSVSLASATVMVPDPLDVKIESLNSSLFPYIYAHVSVKLNGVPLTNLTKENFEVWENEELQTGCFDVTPPESSGGVRLADIVFLIDVSGSMDAEIAGVRNNINNFANSLAASNVDFRLGLVRFGNGSGPNPYIFNSGNLTNDLPLFRSFVNTLSANGGTEPGFLAIRQAITGFNFRPGSQKIFLIVTDEDSDAPRNKQDTINMLLANRITVHAAVNCSYDLSSGDYCNETSVRGVTGGLLFPVQGSYDSILGTIAEQTSGTYVLHYKSSKPNFDATLRTVDIDAFSGLSTGLDTATYMPGASPQITLTPETEHYLDSANPAVENQPLTISASVVDNIPPNVTGVDLYYKTTQIPNALPTSYIRATMISAGGNRWQYTIPGSSISRPGLSFYITATDGQSSSSSPKVDPADNPHQIAVLPNQAPVIQHNPLSLWIGDAGQNVPITATISDSTCSVSSSALYYRKAGELLYTKAVNSRNGSSVQFSVAIPGTVITEDFLAKKKPEIAQIEYYIEAQDDLGVVSRHGTADNPHIFSLLPRNGDWDEDGLTNAEEDQNLDGRIAGDTNNNRKWDQGETWTETDPLNPDTDGDALPDGWEVKGHNGLDLKGLGADPLRKDIFIEIDWMDGLKTHPRIDALNAIKNAFADAPVWNPSRDKGIQLHLDYGQDRLTGLGPLKNGGDEIPFSDNVNIGVELNSGTDWSLFDKTIRKDFFDNARDHVFHYCVFVNRVNGKSASGVSRGVPGSDFIVSLGHFTEGTSLEYQAGTFMHELGHNLGLKHGGGDSINYKPNYLSVMNYAFQFTGVRHNGTLGNFDYSEFDSSVIPPLSEECLNELVGFNAGGAVDGYGSRFYIDGQVHEIDKVNDKIDWDLNKEIGACVAESINNSNQEPDYGLKSILQSYNDWSLLKFDGNGRIGAFGMPTDTILLDIHYEMTEEEVKAIVPPSPSGLVARISPRLVRLGWTPLNLEIIKRYRVYKKMRTSDYALIANPSNSIYDDYAVREGETYTYAVTSIDAYGNESTFLQELQITVPFSIGRKR